MKTLRLYKAVVAPAGVGAFDEGLSLIVGVAARDRKHAMRRLKRYLPGTVMGLWPVSAKIQETDFPFLPLRIVKDCA